MISQQVIPQSFGRNHCLISPVCTHRLILEHVPPGAGRSKEEQPGCSWSLLPSIPLPSPLVHEKSRKEKSKGSLFLRVPEFSHLRQRQRKDVIKFCYSKLPSAQQFREPKACLPSGFQKLHAIYQAWSHSPQSVWTQEALVRPETRKRSECSSFKLKKILGMVFRKIMISVLHLDIFASIITPNTVSYFISVRRQLGTLHVHQHCDSIVLSQST